VNTPSHAILNLALLGRTGRPARNVPVVLGALLPDVPIVFLYAFATLVLRQPSELIWSKTYFEPVWQTLVDVPHSFPLIAAGWAVARWRKATWWELLFASMFLHSVLDYPVHTDDAHRHFFPLSGYRFDSPVSYWDPARYGREVALVEIALVLAAGVRVFGLLRRRASRVVLVAVGAFYVAGAGVLLRPCLVLPWPGMVLTDDGRCGGARANPAARARGG